MSPGCPPTVGSLRRWWWWWGAAGLAEGFPGVSFPYLTLKSGQAELCELGLGPAVLPPAVQHPAVPPGVEGGGEAPFT